MAGTPSDNAADESSAAATAVAAWASKHLGNGAVEVAEAGATIGDGFDTTIVATRFTGEGLDDSWRNPVILRIHPTAGRMALAEREAVVQGFLADSGYPAPRVLAVIPPGDALDRPVQVMERVPGRTVLDVCTSRWWRAPRTFGRLGEMHARLHALPIDDWPDDGAGPTAMAEHRLRLVRDVVENKPEVAGPGLARALELADAIVPTLAVDEPAVCHGDFHPLNVLTDGPTMHVIDWTDGALGDAQGDVARLLGLLAMAPVAAPKAMQRRLLRTVMPNLVKAYRRGYTSLGGRIDEERVARWRPIHLAHDWARAELTLHESGEERVHHDVVPWIVEQFSRSIYALPES